MNVRKTIDYSQMYQAIDEVMVQKLPQMQLYTAIGEIVCSRSEKGAAVMASEYVRACYPDVQGFSPRNLRRMRDFYHAYENHPVLLSLAMELGWTQNVVIMEADLAMDLREWYMKAAKQFDWTKAELIDNIASNAHENIVLTIEEELYNIVKQDDQQSTSFRSMSFVNIYMIRQHVRRIRKWWLVWKGRRRRCHTVLWERFVATRSAFMRC